ncbi:MAG: hypothetical protein HZA53_16650 [Planctomycetes bacterium]|nr:hypothetical protein [Planctomycetota bacterium]
MARPLHPLLACALLPLVVPACQLVRGVAEAPGKVVGAVTGGAANAPTIDLDDVRSMSMRYADRIVAQVDAATYLYTARDPSPEALERSLMWRIGAAERAFEMAAHSHPAAALADLVALCSYGRKLHETYWTKTLGENDRPMIEVWTSLEQQGLEAVSRHLTAEQSKALREVLARWSQGADDPDELLRSGAPSFEELASNPTAGATTGSLLGILGLDPLDSLEPAAREVARTRELAERAVFLAQRLPRTLAWRMELLSIKTARQPAVKSVIEDLERTSKAAESLAATADALPEKLRVESDLVLQRVSTELSAQRAGLVNDLEKSSAPTQALLGELQKTLDAGTRLSQSLESTTRTVEALVTNARAPEAPAAVESAPKEPGKPFDPAEYTALATALTGTLHELDTAAANLDRSLPAVQKSVDEAATRVDRTIERAWRLAIVLVLVAVAASVLGFVIVRRLSNRAQRPPSPA